MCAKTCIPFSNVLAMHVLLCWIIKIWPGLMMFLVCQVVWLPSVLRREWHQTVRADPQGRVRVWFSLLGRHLRFWWANPPSNSCCVVLVFYAIAQHLRQSLQKPTLSLAGLLNLSVMKTFLKLTETSFTMRARWLSPPVWIPLPVCTASRNHTGGNQGFALLYSSKHVALKSEMKLNLSGEQK